MQRIRKNKIYLGDSLEILKTFPDDCVDMCVTSPPYYGLRDYGEKEQIGLEKTPEQYVQKLVNIFREVKRILKPEGTFWLNIGDSYAGTGTGQKDAGIASFGKIKDFKDVGYVKTKLNGYKSKDLIGIPWMVAFALRNDGWYLRQDIIWAKPNPMPEPVKDRCTKAHEYIFLLSKNQKYYYDAEAIKTEMFCSEHDKRSRQGRKRFPTALVNGIRGNNPDKIYEFANKRSVWTITTKPYKEAHFATFPQALIKPMILAGCPEGGIVLDPFMGAGTTAVVCKKLHRNYLGIELNPKYIELANKRIEKTRETLFAI
jgi:DNA modification methylase